MCHLLSLLVKWLNSGAEEAELPCVGHGDVSGAPCRGATPDFSSPPCSSGKCCPPDPSLISLFWAPDACSRCLVPCHAPPAALPGGWMGTVPVPRAHQLPDRPALLGECFQRCRVGTGGAAPETGRGGTVFPWFCF